MCVVTLTHRRHLDDAPRRVRLLLVVGLVVLRVVVAEGGGRGRRQPRDERLVVGVQAVPLLWWYGDMKKMEWGVSVTD